jgi:hypothetical protein
MSRDFVVAYSGNKFQAWNLSPAIDAQGNAMATPMSEADFQLAAAKHDLDKYMAPPQPQEAAQIVAKYGGNSGVQTAAAAGPQAPPQCNWLPAGVPAAGMADPGRRERLRARHGPRQPRRRLRSSVPSPRHPAQPPAPQPPPVYSRRRSSPSSRRPGPAAPRRPAAAAAAGPQPGSSSSSERSADPRVGPARARPPARRDPGAGGKGWRHTRRPPQGGPRAPGRGRARREVPHASRRAQGGRSS